MGHLKNGVYLFVDVDGNKYEGRVKSEGDVIVYNGISYNLSSYDEVTGIFNYDNNLSILHEDNNAMTISFNDEILTGVLSSEDTVGLDGITLGDGEYSMVIKSLNVSDESNLTYGAMANFTVENGIIIVQDEQGNTYNFEYDESWGVYVTTGAIIDESIIKVTEADDGRLQLTAADNKGVSTLIEKAEPMMDGDYDVDSQIISVYSEGRLLKIKETTDDYTEDNSIILSFDSTEGRYTNEYSEESEDIIDIFYNSNEDSEGNLYYELSGYFNDDAIPIVGLKAPDGNYVYVDEVDTENVVVKGSVLSAFDINTTYNEETNIYLYEEEGYRGVVRLLQENDNGSFIVSWYDYYEDEDENNLYYGLLTPNNTGDETPDNVTDGNTDGNTGGDIIMEACKHNHVILKNLVSNMPKLIKLQ